MRKFLSLALAAALVAATTLPAAANHRGNHGGRSMHQSTDRWIGTGEGRGNWGGAHNRGSWGGSRNSYNHGWNHRHGTPNWVAPAIGFGLLFGGVAVASQYYAPPQTCYPHGCYTLEYGQWVWHPRY